MIFHSGGRVSIRRYFQHESKDLPLDSSSRPNSLDVCPTIIIQRIEDWHLVPPVRLAELCYLSPRTPRQERPCRNREGNLTVEQNLQIATKIAAQRRRPVSPGCKPRVRVEKISPAA